MTLSNEEAIVQFGFVRGDPEWKSLVFIGQEWGFNVCTSRNQVEPFD